MKINMNQLKKMIRESLQEAPYGNGKYKWEYGKDLPNTAANYDAHTLDPDVIGTNDSGWTVKGRIHDDYVEWVNEFSAQHPQYGRLWGDFGETVFADSEEGFKHFVSNHKPTAWNYADI